METQLRRANKFYYNIFKKTCSDLDLGEYISFGIRVISNDFVEILEIEDISTYEPEVAALTARCNTLSLEPIHLTGVIEDFLGQ